MSQLTGKKLDPLKCNRRANVVVEGSMSVQARQAAGRVTFSLGLGLRLRSSANAGGRRDTRRPANTAARAGSVYAYPPAPHLHRLTNCPQETQGCVDSH